VLKMALYRDLAKDDPLEQGLRRFPSGLDDEYFRQLTAERRQPFKRHGFTSGAGSRIPARPTKRSTP
jgi:hypothetical protein